MALVDTWRATAPAIDHQVAGWRKVRPGDSSPVVAQICTAQRLPVPQARIADFFGSTSYGELGLIAKVDAITNAQRLAHSG
jgi:hypothetical protein